jgi:hypothetical protein
MEWTRITLEVVAAEEDSNITKTFRRITSNSSLITSNNIIIIRTIIAGGIRTEWGSTEEDPEDFEAEGVGAEAEEAVITITKNNSVIASR